MGGDRYTMRKLAQGYAGPSTRPGCHSCEHAIKPQGFGASLDCREGGFLVHPYGTCNHYAPRARAAARPPETTHEKF